MAGNVVFSFKGFSTEQYQTTHYPNLIRIQMSLYYTVAQHRHKHDLLFATTKCKVTRLIAMKSAFIA